MKKYFLYFITLFALTACSKSEIEQTRSTISKADSLMTTAREGMKTLDSLRVILKDSQAINKVITPEIEKQRRAAERAIEENRYSLDSISQILRESAKNIEKGTDIVKTVDSARQTLGTQSGPVEILSTISKTLEKLSSKAPSAPEKEPATTSEPSYPETSNDSESSDPSPISSGAARISESKITLTVSSLEGVSQEIQNGIHLYSAVVESESYGQKDERRTRVLNLSIPNRHYDRALDYFAQSGTLRTKTVESRGVSYDPDLYSTLELTVLEEKASSFSGSGSSVTQNENEGETSYSDRSKSAFSKGLDASKEVLLLLLPFWPLLLLIVAFLIYRSYRKKKKAEAFVRPEQEPWPREEVQKNDTFTSPSNPLENQEHNKGKEDGDPYEKYKPKF